MTAPPAATVTGFREARARGTVRPDGLTAHTLRQAAHTARLHAVSFWNATALTAARERDGEGPLDGVPLLIKDNIDTRDAPTTAGTPVLSGRVPPHDAPAVTVLRRAGAVIAGKCTQHELALGASSVNPVSGTPRNPLDPTRTAGGSSGGAAAAVASGLVPAALGTDTHGSVRIPASFCGLFGFRPTVGRYPTGGLVPVSPSRDTPGPLARSMDDLLLLDAVLSGRPVASPGPPARELTLGVQAGHLPGLDAEVATVFGEARAACAAAGVTLVELDLADEEREGNEAGAVLSTHEFVPALAAYLAERYPDLTADRVLDGVASPDVRTFAEFMRASTVSPTDYRDARRARDAVRERMRRVLDGAGVSAVLHPTVPCLPDLLDELGSPAADAAGAPAYLRYLHFTSLAGALALPAVTVPVHRSGALPVGLELRGVHGRDEDLLGAAAALAPVLRGGTGPAVE